ncbi:MAG: PLP-dependent aminotransferase family protein [Candidatus Methylacidiphilales bacterium]|nr:PLP-dependent aminotransferase family protein [Candidatus Methylacidiphilales bacterium]
MQSQGNVSPAAEADHLYEKVADKIAQLIAQGDLRAGERIPSVRRMSSQQGVSIATVLQAYLVLENRGLISARPKSGYYVQPRRRIFPPEPAMSKPATTATLVGMSGLLGRLLEAVNDPSILPMGAACPSPELLPTQKLNRILATLSRQAGDEAVEYDMPPGCPALRRQVARRSLDWGCSLSSEDFVTTSGGMEALNLCLRAVAKPGDTIALDSPTYFGILQSIESLGMKALELPCHPRTGICLESLEAELKRQKISAVLSVTNFNNPLGSFMPESHKRALVEMLARAEVPLIEDDIYGDLAHHGPRPKVAKAYDTKGLVMLCGSYSKTLAPGYRVGWVAPGPRYLQKVKHLKYTSTVASASLPQMAVAEFLQNGGYDHHIRTLRFMYGEQVSRMCEAIGALFPAGTRVTRPEGGFVLWVELPKAVDSLQLQDDAMRHRISIAPGPLFSSQQKYSNFVRLSCGHPWSARFEQGIETLGRLAKEQLDSRTRLGAEIMAA